MQFNVGGLKSRLMELNTSISRYHGEVASLNFRKDSLEKSVGIAKGRLSHKATVDAFLEELQAEAHAKRVGDFEKLLTALVSEVLPEEAPIGLDLEIERGQPSLDIVSRHSADRSEDIFDDQGGALTNVVSLGLRMIAVVRSGMNRFLLLDESDCWVSNNRVPAFYSVLKEAARKINIQCLAISHHDISAFGEGIDTATLNGHPSRATGVRIENNPKRYQWKDDEPGIRWIRLKNFQGYVDETVHLTPGVNALIGENNIGKSSFVRAFRAVFYGEARDSLIRHGERQCSVEIGFSHGRVLHWDRQTKRNPINLWRYLNSDGSIVTEEGIAYESGGRTPPDWVSKIFKIGPVEGMDIHAIKQKEPVFLLNKPGSVRAAVLSVGQESGHIRKMISLHKEQSNADAATVKNGEVEMNFILDRLQRLASIESVKSQMDRAEKLLSEIEIRDAETHKLQEIDAVITTSMVELISRRKRSLSLKRLPSVEDVRVVENEADKLCKAASAAEALVAARAKVNECKAKDLKLGTLPSAVPELLDVISLERSAEEIATLSKRVNSMGHSLATLDKLPKVPEITDVTSLQDLVSEINTMSCRLEKGRFASSYLSSVPDEMPEIVRSDELIKVGKAVKDVKASIAGHEARQQVLLAIPSVLPELDHSLDVSEVLATLMSAQTSVGLAESKNNETDKELAAASEQLNELVALMGHTCPICSTKIEDPSILVTSHTHSEDCNHAQ